MALRGLTPTPRLQAPAPTCALQPSQRRAPLLAQGRRCDTGPEPADTGRERSGVTSLLRLKTIHLRPGLPGGERPARGADPSCGPAAAAAPRPVCCSRRGRHGGAAPSQRTGRQGARGPTYAPGPCQVHVMVSWGRQRGQESAGCPPPPRRAPGDAVFLPSTSPPGRRGSSRLPGPPDTLPSPPTAPRSAIPVSPLRVQSRPSPSCRCLGQLQSALGPLGASLLPDAPSALSRLSPRAVRLCRRLLPTSHPCVRKGPCVDSGSETGSGGQSSPGRGRQDKELRGCVSPAHA